MLGSKPLILLVEDDKDLAQLNAKCLMRQGYNTLIANTITKAREHFSAYQIDLFVLDIALPDGSGLVLCNEFRKKSDAPILFLTSKTETMYKVAGFDAGGDYYLTKPFDRTEFLAVVKCLINRAHRTQIKPVETTAIVKGSLTLKLDERKAYVHGREAGLSSSEFATLLLLVQNEDTKLSYDYIYETVWQADMHNDTRALRQQISRIKKKLGEEAEGFSIYNEQGHGYIFTAK